MVDEGSAVFGPVVGVYCQTRTLVYQQNVFILVDDVQLGGCHGEVGVVLPGLVEEFVIDIQLQHISRLQPGIPLRSCAVELDALDADVFLGQGGGEQGNGFGQKPVQPLACVVGTDGKLFHGSVPRVHFKMPVDPVGEFLGGVVAQLALAVVHGGHLQDHGQVSSCGDRDGVHGHLDAQDVHILILQAQPVIGGLGVPGDDVHHQVDLVFGTDGAHAEQLCHIHNADAPQLNVVADELRCGADEGGLGDLADLHGIVRDETVAPLEELQCGFAFAHAAVAHEQQPFAVDLHQHAVAGDPGGQGGFQIEDDVGGQGGGGLRGAQDGDGVLFGHGQTLLVHREAPGDQQGRGLVGEQLVEDGGPLLGRFPLQIADFHVAQDLQPHGLEIVEIARDLEPGAGHILHGEADGFVVRRSVGHFHLEFLHQGGQGNAVGFNHMCTSCLHHSYRFIIPVFRGISTCF